MTDSFILDIMEKFNSSSIVDLDISRDGSRIALKKADACVACGPVVAATCVEQPAKSAAETVAPVAAASVKEEKQSENAGNKSETSAPASKTTGTEILKSPIVGTFYRSPSPDSPAYAEVGKSISKGEPLCILEAMKMMNTMNADFDLEIVEILVQNGELVEYDQPLFSVRKK